MKKIYSLAAMIAIIAGTLQLNGMFAQAADYTLADVQTHNSTSSCWTIVSGKVYDLTSYIAAHPGGVGTISSICGVDGTAAFTAMHGSSAAAQTALASLLIGNLATADTAAPSLPTNLATSVISSSQINLSWTASTDNVGVTGYKIYRDGTLFGTVTGTTLNNVGLTASTLYSYTIAAYDAAGNTSSQTASVSATTLAATPTPDTVAPSVPTVFTATVISSSQINLSWTASTDNVGVAGYNIYRDGTLIGSTAATTFNNSGLTPSTSYSYTISAFDAASNSSAQTASVTATTLGSATTDTTSPSVPTNLAAAVISATQINLSWTVSTDPSTGSGQVSGVTGYNIYRNGILIGTSATPLVYNTGLTASTLYSYSVAAYDAAGNVSAQTAPVSGTTLSGTTPTPTPTPPPVNPPTAHTNKSHEDEHGNDDNHSQRENNQKHLERSDSNESRNHSTTRSHSRSDD